MRTKVVNYGGHKLVVSGTPEVVAITTLAYECLGEYLENSTKPVMDSYTQPLGMHEDDLLGVIEQVYTDVPGTVEGEFESDGDAVVLGSKHWETVLDAMQVAIEATITAMKLCTEEEREEYQNMDLSLGEQAKVYLEICGSTTVDPSYEQFIVDRWLV